MNVTQTGDMFDCDCGFSWRRGQSGYHHCEDGLRAKIAALSTRNSHLTAQRDALLYAIRPFELAYMTWNGTRAMNQFGTALTPEAFKRAAETVHIVKNGLPVTECGGVCQCNTCGTLWVEGESDGHTCKGGAA